MSCPACFTGAVHHNERPSGRLTTLHGVETYIAEPPKGVAAKGIIVIVPDAFGLPFINNQILADNYASKGHFITYLPDFMDGKPAPLWIIESMGRIFFTKTLWDWVRKPYDVVWTLYGFVPFAIQNRYSVSMPKVVDFLTAVRKDEGAALPIGVAGFCWGAKHAVNLAHGIEAKGTRKPLVDASFIAHPSQLAVPAEIEPITKPLALAVGDNDKVLSMKETRQIEDILKAKAGLKSEVVVYKGAGHGFAVRADLGNEKQSQQAKDAEVQAIRFFSGVFQDVKY